MTPPTKPGQEGVLARVERWEDDEFVVTFPGWDKASRTYHRAEADEICRMVNAALSPLLTELEALRAVVKAADELAECLTFWCDDESVSGGAGDIFEDSAKALEAFTAAKKSALLGGEGK